MVVALVAVLALTGCIGVATPTVGLVYTDVKWGGEVGTAAAAKTGSAESTTILSLFATGDSSIEAAAKNGGITKIHHVDYHTTNILGVYGKLITTVYGE
jgi:hypothetical protein